MGLFVNTLDAFLQDSNSEDLYRKLKTLQRQLELLEVQEEYIKDEQKNLKRELLRAQVRGAFCCFGRRLNYLSRRPR